MVAAIHRSTGQIDDHIGAIDLVRPRTKRSPIPNHCLHATGLRQISATFAREHHALVAALAKRADEHLSNLSTAAGDNDFHDADSFRLGMI